MIILLYRLDMASNELLNTKIVVIEEQFGTSFTAVASIVKKEVGLDLPPERFRAVNRRGCTLLVAAHLTDEEISDIQPKIFRDLLLKDQPDWSILGMIFEGIASHQT